MKILSGTVMGLIGINVFGIVCLWAALLISLQKVMKARFVKNLFGNEVSYGNTALEGNISTVPACGG